MFHSEYPESPAAARVRDAVNSFLQDPAASALGPLDHLEWALKLPACDGLPAVPEPIAAPLSRALNLDGHALAQARASSLAHWRERKRVLDPLWAHRFGSLPAHVQSVLGPKKNLLVLSEMLEAIAWPDARLVADLRNGFPLLGEIPRSGALPQIPFGECSESAASLRAQASFLNAETLCRVRRPAGLEDPVRAVFEAKCEQEVSDGHARWRSLPGKCVLTARFPADEGWKGNSRRVRCIDDFSASLINAAVSVGETVQQDTLDRFVAVLCEVLQAGRGGAAIRKEDFVSAFKTLPLASSHLQFAVVTWDSAEARGQGLQLLACPFGAVASVYNWERFGAAVRSVLARLFFVVFLRFVDDLFGADPVVPEAPFLATPAGASEVAREVVEDLLGWDFDASKRVSDSASAPILGVEVGVDSAGLAINLEIGAAKLAQWESQIRAVLKRNVLHPAEAKKLAGRLSWGASAVFGRAARVHLAPLYKQASGASSALTGRVVRSLRWWLRFLKSVPRRTVLCSSPAARLRCIVYSDATGRGNLAWAICLPDRRLWSASAVPDAVWRWARYRKNQVATWELMAAICALHWLLCEQLGDLEVLLFVDNQTALGTLVRGSSRQSDWNDLIGDLWFRVAQAGVLLYSFYVPSHLNLADAPTRPREKAAALEAMQAAGFTSVPWSCPPDAPWF